MALRQRRIETQEAKERRGERRLWAEPGGSHDRLVAVLARVREKLTGRDRIAYRIGGSGDISPEHEEGAEESV